MFISCSPPLLLTCYPRAKYEELEPRCEALRTENAQGKIKLLMLKELHNKLTKESEQIKQEKAEQRQRKVISLVPPAIVFLTNTSGRDFERDVGTF